MDNSTHNVTEAIKKLRAINFALENLEVKGRQNMDILLGSMQALEKATNIIDAAFRELTQPAPQPEIKLEVISEEEAPAAE